MNILVTGGAGYIGSHTLQQVLAAGHEAWAYDNLEKGHQNAVPEGRLVVGDLHDTDRLTQTLIDRKIDAVMHFAAFALVGESVEQPALYYNNNIGGGISLANAMLKAGVKRIVFSSTTATYGVPDVVPIRETERQEPINPYGFSKFVFEKLLHDYAHAYGWGYAALRYFNAAGASVDGSIGEDHAPESHIIPIVLEVALGQREKILVFGDDYPTPDGTCIRDYVHVLDLASAHLKALDKLEDGSAIRVNLGTGRGNSVLEIIEACRRITGHPIPFDVAERRPGDPPELIADASLARNLLGWEPEFTDIEGIIRTAWQWHQSHPNGYDG
jgi:UDP-glucose 4-epimerase